MCSEDLCNGHDYDVHTERANRLFGKNNNRARFRSRNSTVASATPSTPLARTTPNGRTPTGTEDEVEGEEYEEEKEEIFYEEAQARGLEQLQRVPRQLREGRKHAR